MDSEAALLPLSMSVSESQLKADELRDRYPHFRYESYSHREEAGDLVLQFEFACGDLAFKPETRIKSISGSKVASVDSRMLDRLVFHIGLIEMLSYWKATCSPEIVVKAGFLNDDQVRWWKNLLMRGMGEFFYVNQIDFRSPEFVNITVEHEGPEELPEKIAVRGRTLVMASGGKDTAVTLQLLKESGEDFNCLMLNPLPAASNLVAAAGIDSPLVLNRKIDPLLLDLNRRGYLNGHTPFSALLSFLGVSCATLFDYQRVIVSNERSSNEGNIEFLGTKVNHQYSKTFEFEQSFRDYSQRYVAPGIEYFSLLRPLYEIQIIRMMSSYPKFLPLFRSCNRNQLEGDWCGRCPKCISVFTLFYPFLPHEELIATFGSDFFDREDAVPMIRQLAGADGHKPFECVGTHDETIAALHLGVQRAKEAGELSPVLRVAESEILPHHPEAAALARAVQNDWGEEHCLPELFEKLVRAGLTKRTLGSEP